MKSIIITEDLNSLKFRAYHCAVVHGWHKKPNSDEHYLWMVITELAEATNANRSNKLADEIKFKDEYQNTLFNEKVMQDNLYNFLFEKYIKDTFQDKISDTCIRLLDLAGLLDIGLTYIQYELIGKMPYFKVSWTEFCFDCANLLSDKKQNTETKINYVLAGVINFAIQRNINIYLYINLKMKYNELRPYKHNILY